MPILWKITASSFIAAILRSHWAFIDDLRSFSDLDRTCRINTRGDHRTINFRHFLECLCGITGNHLTIFVTVRSLVTGLIRSRLYPISKSRFHFVPECFSRIGIQTSFVAPG